VSAEHATATFHATGTTASANVSKPSGTAEGDLLLAFHNCDVGDLADMGTPTGGATWEPGVSQFQDPGMVKTWFKWCGAGEPSTYGFTQSSGADGAITIVRVTGADSSVDPSWFGPNGDSAAGATITTPASTPIGSDDLEYRMAAGTGNSTAHFWFFDASTPTLNPLDQVSSGDFANHRVAHRQLTSSDVTSTIIARSRNAANTSNVGQGGSRQAVTVVVKSASTTVTGTMDVQLPALAAAGAGDLTVSGELDATLPALAAAGQGTVTVSGSADIGLPALTVSLDGNLTVIAELSAILPTFQADGLGSVRVSAALDVEFPAFAAAGAGDLTVSGELDATLPAFQADGSGTATVRAALSAILPAFQASGAGEVTETVRGSLAVVLPALQASGAGSVVVVGSLDADLPALSFAGEGISYVSGYRLGAITGPASSTEPTATGPATTADRDLTGPAIRWGSSGPAVRFGATGPSSTTEPTATGPASSTEPTATGPATGRDVSGPAVSREISGVGV
jgi:hypothetical protein